jgi:hypothetical protein
MKLRICYRAGDLEITYDYTPGEVEPLVKHLAQDGLGISTVSLILRLLSTWEELALHQENGFALESIGWRRAEKFMKIDLGGGAYIEPDDGRKSRFRMRILSTEPIPHTGSGKYAHLECGHRVMIFGNLEMMGGHALCPQCRDAAKEQH